jgi:hypothetical protein
MHRKHVLTTISIFKPAFSFSFSELVKGGHLLCLWPNNIANPLGTNSSNTDSSKTVLLQVRFHL